MRTIDAEMRDERESKVADWIKSGKLIKGILLEDGDELDQMVTVDVLEIGVHYDDIIGTIQDSVFNYGDLVPYEDLYEMSERIKDCEMWVTDGNCYGVAAKTLLKRKCEVAAVEFRVWPYDGSDKDGYYDCCYASSGELLIGCQQYTLKDWLDGGYSMIGREHWFQKSGSHEPLRIEAYERLKVAVSICKGMTGALKIEAKKVRAELVNKIAEAK